MDSPPMSHSSKELQESGSILEAHATGSTNSLQLLRRENKELTQLCDAMRQDAELVPELEREMLYHADRADAFLLRVHELEERNRSLEVLAHARGRSKQHLVASRIVRTLLRSRLCDDLRRAFGRWHQVPLHPLSLPPAVPPSLAGAMSGPLLGAAVIMSAAEACAGGLAGCAEQSDAGGSKSRVPAAQRQTVFVGDMD
jgi:hypothetical protein